VRLKAEQEGETVVEDVVLGQVRFANDQLDDMILLRSDGTPTYMLAVVVDDYDMDVTHIIRGADHLNNAARQLQMIRAMDWPVPVYGHIPLIHGADGAKLSKRHGALAVDAYRDMGYLPEAMRNYLARLGWSHGDDEIFSTEQAVAWFDLTNVGRSPARFDFKKLDNLNAHYIRVADDSVLVEQIVALLGAAQPPRALSPRARARLIAAMAGLKERAKTLVELVQAADFLFTDGPRVLDAAAEKILDEKTRVMLSRLLPWLFLIPESWTAVQLEETIRRFAESEGAKLGQVAQPIRAALTGRTTSPPVFDILAVLGREESIERLRACAAEPSGSRGI
jgi:glutamyl-tRNA synthetase